MDSAPTPPLTSIDQAILTKALRISIEAIGETVIGFDKLTISDCRRYKRTGVRALKWLVARGLVLRVAPPPADERPSS
jgi:hypothetical protein